MEHMRSQALAFSGRVQPDRNIDEAKGNRPFPDGFHSELRRKKDDLDQDVCAVISGPNGFYANHRIKALQDFSWIEEEKASSEASIAIVVQPSFCAEGAAGHSITRPIRQFHYGDFH